MLLGTSGAQVCPSDKSQVLLNNHHVEVEEEVNSYIVGERENASGQSAAH